MKYEIAHHYCSWAIISRRQPLLPISRFSEAWTNVIVLTLFLLNIMPQCTVLRTFQVLPYLNMNLDGVNVKDRLLFAVHLLSVFLFQIFLANFQYLFIFSYKEIKNAKKKNLCFKLLYLFAWIFAFFILFY